MAARNYEQIKMQMTDSFIGNGTIQEMYELIPDQTFEQQFSKVSIENIVFSVVAFSIWTLESLWDIFKAENEAEMARQKIHSKNWYRQKALDFQYGFLIIPGTDQFDNQGATDEQIAASKIVSQAACVKLISSTGYGILRVKVAKNDGLGGLTNLNEIEQMAIRYYFLRHVTDAGTQLKVTSGQADDLKLHIDIYYDPLVLSTTGSRLDGNSDTPVIDGINQFLKSLEFNGALIISDLTAYLRKIEGVKLAKVKQAASKYGAFSYDTTDILNAGVIDEIRIADSGYMAIDMSELQINYIVMPE